MFVCEVMASEHNKIKTVLLRLIIRGVTKWLGWLLRTQWPKASHFCSFTRLKYKRVRVHWTSYCLAITACWARHERARTRRRRRLIANRETAAVCCCCFYDSLILTVIRPLLTLSENIMTQNKVRDYAILISHLTWGKKVLRNY